MTDQIKNKATSKLSSLTLATKLELAGGAALLYGATLVHPALPLVLAGIAVLAVGVLMSWKEPEKLDSRDD